MEDFEKAYKKVNVAKAVFLFLFSPSNFIRMSKDHDISLTLTRENDLRKKFKEGTYQPDEKRYSETARERTKKLRSSLFRSGMCVILSILLAILTGRCLYNTIGPSPKSISSLLQVLGAGVILWATLWELGWNLRSWGGETLPERLHSWLFRLYYVVGTYSLLLSVSW